MPRMPTCPSAPSLARPHDNFLPLRHFAAWLVLYSHSYALAFNPEREIDLVARMVPGLYGGKIAVHMFFAISGYLVTSSLLRHAGVLRYVRHRFLRIYPAYLACLLACVLILGPALTTLSLHDYFSSSATWDHLRGNLIPISFVWVLPGVFERNPLPDIVNGSLWSLGLEVRWYFYLALLAALGVVRRRWAFTLVAGAVLLLGAWELYEGKPDPLGYRSLSQTFLLAALLAHWRNSIRISYVGIAAVVLLAVLTHGTPAFETATVVGVVYGVMWCAYRLRALPWPRDLDLSYGLFLYGYPVQQVVMSGFPTLSPLALCLASTCAALPLAAGSWYLIERPSLRFKRAQRREVADADPP
jgi:peptidoglycan/LPS O-acetylase OafA/YrhL